MKVEKILKIGKIVEIEILDELDYSGSYLTKVEDMEKGKFIKFLMPMEKSHIVPLRIKENIRINMTEDDGVYSFKGVVTSRESKQIAIFSMEYPEKLDRLQRRNYVRVDYNCLVLYTREKEKLDDKEKEEEIYKGVTLNLSGGGMSLRTESILEEEENLVFNFTLENGVICKKVKGIVRRIIESKDKKIFYGIEFTEINKKSREDIISYLFKVQRDRRSKGLSY